MRIRRLLASKVGPVPKPGPIAAPLEPEALADLADFVPGVFPHRTDLTPVGYERQCRRPGCDCARIRRLASCRFGVVVLSSDFFAKNWPRRELDALAAREVRGGQKVILPVWHNVNAEDVERFSPTLAAKLAVSTAKGIPTVVDGIVKVLRQAREEKTGEVVARTAAAATDWVGVDWRGRFLAHDGPYENLRPIEDAAFEQSMADALERDGRFKVYLARADKLPDHAVRGYRIVHLTDRSSWRRRIAKGDVLLVAKSTS